MILAGNKSGHSFPWLLSVEQNDNRVCANWLLSAPFRSPGFLLKTNRVAPIGWVCRRIREGTESLRNAGPGCRGHGGKSGGVAKHGAFWDTKSILFCFFKTSWWLEGSYSGAGGIHFFHFNGAEELPEVREEHGFAGKPNSRKPFSQSAFCQSLVPFGPC